MIVVRGGLSDTDPETERVHLELLRRASPGKRLHLALSLSRSVMTLSRRGLAQRFPDASPEDIGLRRRVALVGRALRRTAPALDPRRRRVKSAHWRDAGLAASGRGAEQPHPRVVDAWSENRAFT